MNDRFNLQDRPQAEPVHPPFVLVKEKVVWQYKQLIRDLAQEKAPAEDELNALGADGWELAGVFTESRMVYFYFKRLAE
jgi:hypothetical protein